MRILVTGAGGAAAISVWKSLGETHEIFMADIDPCAAGLYLVPQDKRILIPSGNSPDFTPALYEYCKTNHIQVLIPTVDAELLPLAQNKTLFSTLDVNIPISSEASLELCRDKFKLLHYCEDTGLSPPFMKLTDNNPIFPFPCFAKPCKGSGSNGAMVIHNVKELQQLPIDGSYLIQELLPGEEYSVDVFISSLGDALAGVPRLRMKIDSGIAVACQTKINPELSKMALTIAKKVGITYVANIQFKADREGQFKLLEINPRFPGTLPLTAKAGIDIPKLLLKDICNEPLGSALLEFKEIMVVRFWAEQFFEIEEWRALCL